MAHEVLGISNSAPNPLCNLAGQSSVFVSSVTRVKMFQGHLAPVISLLGSTHHLSLFQRVQDSSKSICEVVGVLDVHLLLQGSKLIEKVLNRHGQGVEALTLHSAAHRVAYLIIQTQGADEHGEVTKSDKSMSLLK